MEVALQARRHDVTTAEGPEQALETLQAWQPDIMVVDVMMPEGTEGFHLVWKVRQLEDERLKNVPIIMATGIHGTTELRFYPETTDGTYEPGEFLPVQGWADKPVDMAKLEEMIQELVGGEDA